MKNIVNLLVLLILFQSCKNDVTISSIDSVNWDKRKVENKLPESLISGTTYLSVYSQIYSQSENRIHDLTSTVSIRNTSRQDTIFIKNADYFDTNGKFIRSYFDQPIYIAPMETIEIIIDELDKKGGTGANFIFDWNTQPNTSEPLFESVMISTYGQQGLSFTTQGKRLN
ncbi:MAG: hypothetical protein BM563_04910 [Bacteroidetes bacterium MedPE-SWsnd-G1]|nr:MAG: hypothetical protein BM563_04910 [Bacteroidetes bacterium MedPE-SWsnd-G1]